MDALIAEGSNLVLDSLSDREPVERTKEWGYVVGVWIWGTRRAALFWMRWRRWIDFAGRPESRALQ